MGLLADWLRRRSAERFARGYAWAASELLRGMSIAEIEAQTESVIDANEFDDGAAKALRDWKLKTGEANEFIR